MFLRKMESRTLFVIAAAWLAVANGVRFLVARQGWATDRTDFWVGATFGVAIGLMLLVVVRKGRGCGRAGTV
jgi:hypothetical protein